MGLARERPLQVAYAFFITRVQKSLSGLGELYVDAERFGHFSKDMFHEWKDRCWCEQMNTDPFLFERSVVFSDESLQKSKQFSEVG